MKRSTLTFLMLGLAATSAAHAEFKCDGRPLTRVDATACAKAAESLAELRRYHRADRADSRPVHHGLRHPGGKRRVGRTAAPEKPERVATAAPRTLAAPERPRPGHAARGAQCLH